eukprot:8642472-Pyramimonas_sp.AAC.1
MATQGNANHSLAMRCKGQHCKATQRNATQGNAKPGPAMQCFAKQYRATKSNAKQCKRSNATRRRNTGDWQRRSGDGPVTAGTELPDRHSGSVL